MTKSIVLMLFFLTTCQCYAQCGPGTPISKIYFYMDALEGCPLPNLLGIKINQTIEYARLNDRANKEFILETTQKSYSENDFDLDSIPGYYIERKPIKFVVIQGECCGYVTYHLYKKYCFSISTNETKPRSFVVNSMPKVISTKPEKANCLDESKSIEIITEFCNKTYPYKYSYSIKDSVNRKLNVPETQDIKAIIEIIKQSKQYNNTQKQLIDMLCKNLPTQFTFKLEVDSLCK